MSGIDYLNRHPEGEDMDVDKGELKGISRRRYGTTGQGGMWTVV